MVSDFTSRLEAKVFEQLHSQRVGYLLGAGSSYLDGHGYPLSYELWDLIKNRIKDTQKRDDIQLKLNSGATGIEQALDLLDDGGAADTPYRHLVTEAVAELFETINPDLDVHIEFVSRLSKRNDPYIKVFSLNYDPLLERAAEVAKIRLVDGFIGMEHAFFNPAVFEEHIGRIHGSFKWRQFDETVRPIHLFKLHGSLGWYDCPQNGVRRCAYNMPLPSGVKRLMIPPQRRKATDTMLPPYAALWSCFRGCLSHNEDPINRLACFGYSLSDEHINTVVEAALAQPNFTLLVFAKDLSDTAWGRWSTIENAIIVTETRCSLKGSIGPGHVDLWRFERVCREI